MHDTLTNKPPLKKGLGFCANCVQNNENTEQQTNTCLFGRFEEVLVRVESALVKMERATNLYNNLKMSRSFRDSHKMISRLEEIEEKQTETLKIVGELAYRISSKPLNEKEKLRKQFEEVLE